MMIQRVDFITPRGFFVYVGIENNKIFSLFQYQKVPFEQEYFEDEGIFLNFISGIFNDESYKTKIIILIKDNVLMFFDLIQDTDLYYMTTLFENKREEYDSDYINSLNLDFPDGFIPVYDFLNPIVK